VGERRARATMERVMRARDDSSDAGKGVVRRWASRGTDVDADGGWRAREGRARAGFEAGRARDRGDWMGLGRERTVTDGRVLIAASTTAARVSRVGRVGGD